MTYQIDQSGKVEDTKTLTIVAFANGKVKILKISSVEKRKLLKAMRILDYPRKTFIFKIFASLVFLLIKDEEAREVVIDREYPGQEGIIKDILVRLFNQTKRPAPRIRFAIISL